MALHLIKLCVGCDTPEELLAWQASTGRKDWRVHTRQTPKRAEELIEGGSLFRVFRGVILCRQDVLGVETHGEGVARRCQIVLSPTLVSVAPTPRGPFQGWRYLAHADAPPDLERGVEASVPSSLALKLRELGAW